MSALICGSLAYDTIMVFQDQFKNHILPDKVHILNVSFLVPRMRREFGGCAGNIAYNLKLLGADPLPMATVGQDFGAVPRALRRNAASGSTSVQRARRPVHRAGVHHHRSRQQPDHRVPSRRDDALAREPRARRRATSTFGIVAPDGREAMLQHVDEFAARGMPFIFDPGQAMPLFDGEEFRAFIDKADLRDRQRLRVAAAAAAHRLDDDEIAERVKAYIVTRGPNGSLIHTRDGDARHSARARAPRRPIRPAAAMRIAPA